MINTTATHETRNEPQEGVPKPSASPVLDGSCAPWTSANLACRLVQIALALYLIPAFLIVLLVGAVGMLVVGMVRLFTRLLGATAGWSEARAGSRYLSSRWRCDLFRAQEEWAEMMDRHA